MAEKKRLLIVDDEEDTRLILGHHFGRKKNYDVLEAADGREALEIFAEQGPIDLVITDIRMPRMSGDELIQRLRADHPYLPIIGITGVSDLMGKLSSLGKGAYYCFNKPLLEDHWPFVDRMVENAIHLHEREREVEKFRATEFEIARMLRHYILRRRVEHPRFRADVELKPVPSDKPSGDYAEFFHRSRNELLFYIADASGKKELMPAFTACLSNMVLHRAHHGRLPSAKELIYEIDGALEDLRGAGAFSLSRFLTFFIGCLDLTTGMLTYVNAGHLPAFLMRGRNGVVETLRLGHTSNAVGHVALLKTEVEEESRQLEADDLLFLYSDGVTACLTRDGEGDHDDVCIDRLVAMVEPLAEAPAREVVEEVLGQLEDQAGDDGFADDTTMLAIRLHRMFD